MIRYLYRPATGELRTDLTQEEVTSAFQDTKGLLWVDFEATPPQTDEVLLTQVFGFHPLAVDDALQETHVPKVDDWETYLYIVLNALALENKEDGAVDMLELDVFLGRNFIVTHHDQPITSVNKVWESCQRDERHLKYGPDHLLYRLVDEVVANYMFVVEAIDDDIDEVEAEIFDAPTSRTLERIFKLKRAALQLRRIVDPMREVLNRLARDDYAVVDIKARIYFRDVYDHLVRLHNLTDSLRDLVGGALDTYLSVINNRMNDIMKTLTIITTIFMPISFIAGFFGMNFFVPDLSFPAWVEEPVFSITLAIMILLPTGMFLWIRRRGWV